MQQSQNNSLVAMPPLAGFFTEQHFRALILPEKDRRMELDLNWLSLQTREHPELQAADFIDFINQCQLTGALKAFKVIGITRPPPKPGRASSTVLTGPSLKPRFFAIC